MMKHITGTLIAYYFYCKRRMWLHANEIKMEDNSEDVAMGKLIEETTYLQRNQNYEQIEIEGIKIDFFDTKNNIIHEVKKSSKYEETHIWQVKYYMHILQKHFINCSKGIVDYPTERKTHKVVFTEDDRNILDKLQQEIKNIINSVECPEKIQSVKCKKCSYYEFCYIGEKE